MIDLERYIDRFYEIDSQIEESKGKLKSDFKKLRSFEPDDELRTEDEISEKSLKDGMYQAGTDHEFKASHIYYVNNQIITVFKKDIGNFMTSCQLEPDERNELLETGNFGGGKG